MPGSEPFIGEHGQLEIVAEFKVEMVCADDCIKSAVKALLDAHPYEEVAYSTWRLEQLAL